MDHTYCPHFTTVGAKLCLRIRHLHLAAVGARASLSGFVIDQPSRVGAESRALFCPSSEPLFHDHRCAFLTPFATAFVPRLLVQELRRRILSSMREHHRCTFLTAFTIAFVV